MNTQPPRPSSTLHLRWGLPLLLSLGLAACGGGDDDKSLLDEVRARQPYAQRCALPATPRGTLDLPLPRGEHCVGKAAFRIADGRRAETLTPNDDTDRRELTLKVWYPVASGPGGSAADYVDPAVWPVMEASLPEELGLRPVPSVRSWSKSGLTPRQGRYPVILFSPGFGGIAEEYTALVEDLASHGYVVVGIDHPYVSGITALSDGRLALADSGLLAQPQALAAALRTVVDDQRQVLDWLQAQDAAGSGSVLRGHLDLQRIGAYGHSFGGAASLHLGREDGRVRAAINMDGTLFGDTTGPWPKPTLLLLGEREADPSYDLLLRDRNAPHEQFTIAGAGHGSFSDLGRLLLQAKPDTPRAALEALDFGSIEPTAGLTIVRDRVLDFFRQHLRQ
jgi:dienelactone hydrolase